MLCHFLISQNDHLNTKVKIMSSLSAEAKERFLEKKKKRRGKIEEVIANTNAGKNVLTNWMLVHFYFKDNENLLYLNSVLDPSHINFNSYQTQTWIQYTGKSAVRMLLAFFFTVHIKLPASSWSLSPRFQQRFLFNSGSQSSRAIEGQHNPVLPAN